MTKIDRTIESVMEFHKTFDHPIVENPTIPCKERQNLRINLIQEEFNELKEALDNGDIVEVADALADLRYVLDGTAIECGLHTKFSEIFDEVHRSNMSKACDTQGEVWDTINKYTEEGVVAYSTEVNGKYLVSRLSDNKTLKSIKYSPANLKPIVEK